MDVDKKILNFYKKTRLFLKENKSNILIHSIDVLNFVKFHEDYLLKKKEILKKNYLDLFFFTFRNIIIGFFIWTLKYFKYFAIKKEIISHDTEVLFFSFLFEVQKNSYKQSQDPIFSKIYTKLKKNKTTTFVLFDFTSNFKFKENQRIVVLKKILSLRNEIKILFYQFKVSVFLLKILIYKKIDFIFFLQLLTSIFSFETKNNLRFLFQFEKIFLNCNPKYLVAPFEGYTWEKIAFYLSKKINPKCKIIGYQNNFIPKNIFWFEDIDELYSPNFIITSGNFNKKKIIRKNKFFKKRVFVVGTNRYSNLKKSKIYKNNCLILPEATNFEMRLLFLFALQLAKLNRSMNFIIRTHPLINLNAFLKNNLSNYNFNLKNIIISKKGFFYDIRRSNIAIYRGSTSIISAIQNNILPVYYNYEKSIYNIDPIYDTKIKTLYIQNEKDFFDVLNNANSLKKKYFHHNRLEAKKFFSPINYSKLNNLVG